MKKYLWDVFFILVFAAIAFAYFMPADLEGRILYRHDASAGRGAGQEQTLYYEQTGHHTRWTNATFSGMPTYQTAPSYTSTRPLGALMDAYHLWLPESVWYVFAYLLGFYIMLRAFNFRRELAALGSILWAFSSYFFIIIAAGHIWKVMALAYLPPMIGGVVLAYRGKYLWGLILTAIFTAFEVKANHVQMTYYFLFPLLFMVIAFLVEAIRQKQMIRFWRATGVCILGAALGILINLSNLYHTWEYGQESMRGKSELVKSNSANQTNSGLDRDYITQWSYGLDETWTLLIPNTKGGASFPLSRDEKAMEKADPELAQFYNYFESYWGTQPGTSGPVYVGAFVLFLFVLGIFIVKGPMKWALLAATILSILLSWGRNFMPLTDFFIDYMPMYAKFRTVASILVIAEFTIPLLAVMALNEIIQRRTAKIEKHEVRAWLISLALTAGICLTFALMPTVFFEFISGSDIQTAEHIERVITQQQPELAGLSSALLGNVAEMHQHIFVADCWRSMWIILLGCGLLLLFRFGKLRQEWLVGLLAVLCLVDMWQINKRYLFDEMFVEKSLRDQPQPKTPTDEQILLDQSLDYRVLNLAGNTFNENNTSYYHKSIGGYHAAKLRRYQELIDAHIQPEMNKLRPAVASAMGDMTMIKGDSLFPVLNMLNAKYFILPLSDNQTVPLLNPYTYGNAWMVDRVEYVDNANDELDALSRLPLRHVAVADKRFESILGSSTEQDTLSRVTITDYQPNQLTYDVQSGKGGVLVFSEIYYPGWTATVDSLQTPIGRVDYVLRAIRIEPGQHKVVLTFKPQSVKTTEIIATIASIVLLLLVIGVLLAAIASSHPRLLNALRQRKTGTNA